MKTIISKKQNIIGMWVNLSRVYEITKCGSFSIKIVYQTDYKEAKDDYLEIKKFYNDVVFSSDGDMICEITKPYEYNPKRIHETLTDINARIESAKNNIRPVKFQNDSCDSLLKIATERLNFSLTDVNKIKDIASVIAQLAGENTIKVEHIAEAVQYRAYLNNEIAVVAECNVIHFGADIQIAMTDIDLKDIDAAIGYLEKIKAKSK